MWIPRAVEPRLRKSARTRPVTVLAAATELVGSARGNSLFLAADACHLLAHVGIFGVLAPAQVWTLANYVLTPREARRRVARRRRQSPCSWRPAAGGAPR